MKIDTICDECINAIKDAGYNDSTIFNYQGVIRRFKVFCKEKVQQTTRRTLENSMQRMS